MQPLYQHSSASSSNAVHHSDRERLEQFLENEGSLLVDLYRQSSLYPGGCTDISRIVPELLKKYRIEAKPVEGEHIGNFDDGEIPHYHAFNLLVLDGVPHILDFTKNQYTKHVTKSYTNGMVSMAIADDNAGLDSIPFLAAQAEANEYWVWREVPKEYPLHPEAKQMLKKIK